MVPVSSNVATSTIFKIHYGKQRGYRVYFRASSGKSPMDITEHDLASFGTEDGNPGNEKQVDFIEVICPAPLLRSGIVIIDTPGLGGVIKAHKTITYDYVPRADAVFFVTDSVESPIGALEIEYLKDILKITQNLYFVQTKTNAVDEEACAARKKNNLSILSRELGLPTNKIPYFTLDSELRFASQEDKDKEILAMSGYPQLMAFVNDVLQPNQQKYIAARALLLMQPVLTHIQEVLDIKKKLLEADSAEKQQEYKQEVEKNQKELLDWQKDELPKLQKGLKKGLQEIRLSASENCNRLRPGGEIQQEFEKMLQEARDAKSIVNIVEDINAKLPEFISRTKQEILQLIWTKVSILLADLAKKSDSATSTELDQTGDEQLNTMNIRQLRIVEMSSGYEKCRNVLIGGSVASGIGGLIGGLLGTIVAPGIGTFIGGKIGWATAALWGGIEAHRLQKKRDLETERNQAMGQLTQCFSKIYGDLQQIIQRVLSEVEYEVTERVEQYIRIRRDELEERKNEIKERALMGLDKKKKEEDELKRKRKVYDEIMQKIAARYKMLKTAPIVS